MIIIDPTNSPFRSNYNISMVLVDEDDMIIVTVINYPSLPGKPQATTSKLSEYIAWRESRPVKMDHITAFAI